MTSADPSQDVWSRLRAIYEGSMLHPDWDLDPYYWLKGDKFRWFSPTTEDEVHAAEERLSCTLPEDLRRLYTEIADGGVRLGPVDVFCGVEDLTTQSDWQLHPRIEEALLRHPGRYVIVDSLPKGFIEIGSSQTDGYTAISMLTGHVYDVAYWDDLPDVIVDNSESEPVPLPVWFMTLAEPSLSVWLERWLDNRWYSTQRIHAEISSEMVEASDLPDPDVVWRGLYRFGPTWHIWEQPPEDTDLAYDAEHAIYWMYVEDANPENNRY